MLSLESHAGTVNAIAFSPDGELMASAGKDGSIRLWAPPIQSSEWNLYRSEAGCLAFSPEDGSHTAFGGSDGILRVLNTRENAYLATSHTHPHPISALGFIGSGSVLFGIGERPGPVARPSTMFILDLATKKERPLSFGVVNGIRAIATIPELKLAAWATDNKRLRVQDVSRPPSPSVTLKNDCRSLAFAPNARWLAVASDWEVLLFDLGRWPSAPITLGRHQGAVSTLAFSPDSRTLFSGSWDNTVRIWDVERQTQRSSLNWPVGNRINALAVSPDGMRAAAAGDAGNIIVWDLD